MDLSLPPEPSDEELAEQARTWEAFGYAPAEAAQLEYLALDLVRRGVAPDLATARRALAATTWRPLALELLGARRRPWWRRALAQLELD